mmetsp:Transcript_39511/g.126075  ORF Transcript_39511/g.126075 Transcript_39511/m.126075 type:complete len:298 (-) Transcript_39511:1616-2509(-)
MLFACIAMVAMLYGDAVQCVPTDSYQTFNGRACLHVAIFENMKGKDSIQLAALHAALAYFKRYPRHYRVSRNTYALDIDIAVVFGSPCYYKMSSVRDVGDVYYENRPNKTRIWEDVTRYGGRVLTIERGFLGKRDYSLGWNVEDVPCGVGAGVLLPYHYGYNVVNTWRMDDSRLILHDVKIPSEIKPSTHGDAYVLIVGQVPWDTQVQPGVGPLSSVEHCKKEGSCRALVAHKRYSDYVYSHYVGKVIEDIRKYSSRAIVFRPHPKTNKKSTLESWFPNSKVCNDLFIILLLTLCPR